MAVRDDIGSRGEAIFYVRITDFCGRKQPLFHPRFLGEKAQTLDYLVELVGAGERTPFFFVQVKTTREGYTKRPQPPRLKVGMSRHAVQRLALYPAPTYLVGIDERREEGYILAILEGMTDPISSFPTNFPLDCANLRLLWEEVRQFWKGRGMDMRHSVFTM
ncbi:MAG TPA: hypothetical protein VN688_20115 [Gemmataceae bacterium]|nr:hypothetical protein [Gemmataceae bacterium]